MDSKTKQFNRYRPELVNIAYGMLGSLMDAQDIVQDAYIKWMESTAEVRNPESYLKTIVSRLCIDHYRSAKNQREEYIGPWLPQPIVDADSASPDSNIELHDQLTIALLHILDKLSPDQRAIYLLHDVFGYKFSEIGELLDKKPAACRKAAQRARQHIHAEKPIETASRSESREIVEKFIEAIRLRDMEKLQAILTDDAVMVSDGGGKVTAAPKPIVSMHKVSKFLIGVTKQGQNKIHTELATVNNRPGLKTYLNGKLHSIWTFSIRDGRIEKIFAVLNPSKLPAE